MSNSEGVKPRLLLVEDDAISRGFLLAVLETLPAQVDAVATMAAALATEARHDLWLLDANLPDGSGMALLRHLRAQHPHTPALAHTADDSPALHAQLLGTGFVEVLVKPLSASRLHHSVQRWLERSWGSGPACTPATTPPPPPALPLWDDAAALSALNGNPEHVASLRKLFVNELGQQHDSILAALHRGDRQHARNELHRIKASSGFVGARRLQAAALRLEQDPSDAAALEQFSALVRQTRSERGVNEE